LVESNRIITFYGRAGRLSWASTASVPLVATILPDPSAACLPEQNYLPESRALLFIVLPFSRTGHRQLSSDSDLPQFPALTHASNL
jgi:hypothetical protein